MITGEFVPENQPIMKILGKDGKEILRFGPNGDIFVHGELVENNKDVIDAFKEFLTDQGYLR
ncbi:hypothetical protein D3C74_201130 [compost metagenome]